MIVEDSAPRAPDPTLIRWLGYGLAVVGVVSGLGAAWFPAQPAQAILLLLALISPLALLACLAVTPAAFEISSLRSHGPMINLVLIMPVAVLVIAVLNTPLVRPEIGMLLALAGAGVGLLVGLWAPGRATATRPMVLLLFLAFYGAGYGWAAPLLVDLRFDASRGERVTAPVMGSHVTYGRGGPRYWLSLGPWGPIDVSRTVLVTRADFAALKTGDQACVTLHPGALAMPWYSAGRC